MLCRLREFDLSALRVLVVDGNRNMRSILRMILSEIGMRNIQTAADPHDALKILEQGGTDLLLTESTVAAGEDGLAIVKWVRKHPASPDPYIPILIVSGFTDEAAVRAAQDAGVNDFIAKPVSVMTVYKHLATLIELDNRRPYIRAGGFLGPDRRRREVPVTVDRRQNRSAPDTRHTIARAAHQSLPARAVRELDTIDT